ncbi:MAG: hypothetical protein OXB95_05285 [Rhodobacteraceae bacterium]|nr:hypothetical protein [Paracoccaceae bacterium]
MTAPTAKGRLPRVRSVPRICLTYDEETHRSWPHVVKFSGGRSSALLTLGLLYARQLKPSRGDAIVFNNTSAEHAATYRFVALCKKIAERRFNIPFFWTEFQTYEDARRGRWARVPGYRLVTPEPYSQEHPYGYRCNGEVFEELISWKQALPTRFSRTCTEFLKIHTTARFLEDWFGRATLLKNSESVATPRLGHWYDESRMNAVSYGDRSEIVRYHLEQPVIRPSQVFQDFTDAKVTCLRNKDIASRTFDSRAQLKGDDAVEFLSFVGLRADEPRRVSRVLERNNVLRDSTRIADGEYVYTPLYEQDIAKEDVLSFWNHQTWDLEIPHEKNLSNCVYCFMKGERALRLLAADYEHSEQQWRTEPESIGWWAGIEERYARVVQSRDDPGTKTRFGFFGANRSGFSEIAKSGSCSKRATYFGSLPCDCTD